MKIKWVDRKEEVLRPVKKTISIIRVIQNRIGRTHIKTWRIDGIS